MLRLIRVRGGLYWFPLKSSAPSSPREREEGLFFFSRGGGVEFGREVTLSLNPSSSAASSHEYQRCASQCRRTGRSTRRYHRSVSAHIKSVSMAVVLLDSKWEQ